MYSIDVDFDVYKQLTVRRTTEDVSYNDVIRDLLGLGAASESKERDAERTASGGWIAKGVRFPKGTEFRSSYKGIVHTGHVEDGGLIVNGKRYTSPSSAAVAITGSAVNGWRFWECRFPGKVGWQSIEALR
ncbi:DUF2924 domain-containing protein [Algiphilus aromaticivorans]|uniref:DUF2924 domain-containing protein n=1 Tax=Algiphilus aromaticivorans TaxID=382454 RepID=UPI0018DD55D5|nr:DUF2924 domain-containing protein [Algiphilus aromaticivorans]